MPPFEVKLMKLKRFSELAPAMRVRVRDRKTVAETRKCRRCGCDMHRIDGTNVFVCGNDECGNAVTTAKFA